MNMRLKGHKLFLHIAQVCVMGCFSLSYSLFAKQTHLDTDQIELFEQIYTAEEEQFVRQNFQGGGGTSSPPEAPDYHVDPPPPKTGYMPVVIVNKSGLSQDRVFFIVRDSTHFVIPGGAAGAGVGEVTLATETQTVNSYNIPLSQLPTSGGNRTALFYMPPMTSSRSFLSLNEPLPFKVTGNTVNDPSFVSPTDGSFYSVYQSFECNLDANLLLYGNVSNVDYFSIPLELAVYSNGSPAYCEGAESISNTGTLKTRTNCINEIRTVLTQAGTTSGWTALPVSLYANPYDPNAANNSKTDIRILSPKQSMQLATSKFKTTGVNPFTKFPANYLQTSSSALGGVTYMNKLHTDWANTTFDFIISGSHYTYVATQLPAAGTAFPIQFTGTAPYPGGTPSSFQVDLGKLSTIALLSGSMDNWSTDGVFAPTGTYPMYGETAKCLSALFAIGMLPLGGTVNFVLDQNLWFKTYRNAGEYFMQPHPGTTVYGGNPWYNVYDEAIHNLMVNSVGPSGVPWSPHYGFGYGSDYDDLLMIDGTLVLKIQGTGATSSNPYVVVTIQEAGDLPNIEATKTEGPYTLLVTPASGGTITSIAVSDSTGNLGSYSVLGSAETSHQTHNYCCFKFEKSGSAPAYIVEVYPKYQLAKILPNESLNTVSESLRGGVAFVGTVTAPNPTTFTIQTAAYP